MATLDSSNIVNNNVIQTDDLLQLYNALSYPGASPQYLVEISGSLEGTASFAESASFALNGGGGGGAVTQIIQGSNISISPNTGIGNVTINALGGGGDAFPYTGGFLVPAIVTGSLMVNGTSSGQNHALIVTGSMIVAAGAITGNLQGTSTTASYVSMSQTASYVSMSQTASYVSMSQTASFVFNADTSSKINVLANNSGVSNLPIVFASSNTAGTQQLQFDNVSPGPTINPSLDAISATSFTGSLFGQATQATNATSSITASRANTIDTINSSNNSNFYPSFTQASATTPALPLFQSNLNLIVNPSTGFLKIPNSFSTTISSSIISSSTGFTGSSSGFSSQTLKTVKLKTTKNTTSPNPNVLTFVDSNNSSLIAETVNTNLNLRYIPSTAKLQITGSVSASSFTGSLTGSASSASLATLSDISPISNQVKTITDATNAVHYLTFVDSDNPSSIEEVVRTNTRLRFNPSIAQLHLPSNTILSASSFTGSLTGSAPHANFTLNTISAPTASSANNSTYAKNSIFLKTTSSTDTTAHYLTFVDSNNSPYAYETLKSHPSFKYIPSTATLELVPSGFGPTSGIFSSFSGSLNGTASSSPTAITADTASITTRTTEFNSSPSGGISAAGEVYYVPEGRDVGVIWNNTNPHASTIYLNTSSAKLGDQVKIFSTTYDLPSPGGGGSAQAKGQVRIKCSGSTTPNTRIIVTGCTGNPSAHRVCTQKIDSTTPRKNDNFYFHWICVSGSDGSTGTTNRTTWQLVEYSALGSTPLENNTWILYPSYLETFAN